MTHDPGHWRFQTIPHHHSDKGCWLSQHSRERNNCLHKGRSVMWLLFITIYSCENLPGENSVNPLSGWCTHDLIMPHLLKIHNGYKFPAMNPRETNHIHTKASGYKKPTPRVMSSSICSEMQKLSDSLSMI